MKVSPHCIVQLTKPGRGPRTDGRNLRRQDPRAAIAMAALPSEEAQAGLLNPRENILRLRKAADDKVADDKVPVGSTAKSQGAYASWDIHNDSYEKYNPATGEMDEVELPDYALIEKLYVPPEQRGAAKGRQLLVEAVDEIRAEHGDIIGISLTADPFGEGKMDTEDLVKYYEDMGFELNGVSDTSMTLKYPIELNKYRAAGAAAQH